MFMGGYQSNSDGGGSITFFRNKGFLFVVGNPPLPPGLKNDVWMVNGVGTIAGIRNVNNGDIIICVNDSPGGNGSEIAQNWILIPRAGDFQDI
jgi:hypothetical protein